VVAVSAAYVPQVGDRVRMYNGKTAIVLAVDVPEVWVKYDDGYRTILFFQHLTKVTPPPTYPERWISVYSDGTGAGYRDRSDADDVAFGDRIALIHLATDGTLTLHPVERDQ
jgi:hypothetical protein